MKNQNGLTLLEVMIVVAIIGLVAAIAIPAVTRLAEDVRADICRTNLNTIDKSKMQWAFDNNKSDTDEPTADELDNYVVGEVPTECVVAGALYDIGNVITPALCSFHGNSMTRPAHFGEAGYAFIPLYDAWVSQSEHYMPGDTDMDGDVDRYDFKNLNDGFALSGTTWSNGDFDNNGNVSFLDYIALKWHYGRTYDPKTYRP